jgi:hypothetical protein
MSQGDINGARLSIFLPRATLAREPFRLLVVDDPVQPMDPAKVDGLGRALHRVAATRQVIFFTHDDRLPAAIRRLGLPVRILQVDRPLNTVLEITAPSERRPGPSPTTPTSPLSLWPGSCPVCAGWQSRPRLPTSPRVALLTDGRGHDRWRPYWPTPIGSRRGRRLGCSAMPAKAKGCCYGSTGLVAAMPTPTRRSTRACTKASPVRSRPLPTTPELVERRPRGLGMDPLAAAARELLDDYDTLPRATWPRAATRLARQPLEATVADHLDCPAPGLGLVLGGDSVSVKQPGPPTRPEHRSRTPTTTNTPTTSPRRGPRLSPG